MDKSSRNQVKVMLAYENVKLKDLAIMLSDRLGRKYTLDGLSHKLRRSRLTYDEMLVISELLGYEICFVKKENKNN